MTDQSTSNASAPGLSDLVYLYLKEKSQICEVFPVDAVVEAAQQLFRTYDLGGTVYGMANGGNSGTLDHCYVDFRHHPFVDDTKSRAVPEHRPALHVCQPGRLAIGTHRNGERSWSGGHVRGRPKRSCH